MFLLSLLRPGYFTSSSGPGLSNRIGLMIVYALWKRQKVWGAEGRSWVRYFEFPLISKVFNVLLEFLEFASTGASQLHPVLEILCYGTQNPESTIDPESPQGFVL